MKKNTKRTQMKFVFVCVKTFFCNNFDYVSARRAHEDIDRQLHTCSYNTAVVCTLFHIYFTDTFFFERCRLQCKNTHTHTHPTNEPTHKHIHKYLNFQTFNLTQNLTSVTSSSLKSTSSFGQFSCCQLVERKFVHLFYFDLGHLIWTVVYLFLCFYISAWQIYILIWRQQMRYFQVHDSLFKPQSFAIVPKFRSKAEVQFRTIEYDS